MANSECVDKARRQRRCGAVTPPGSDTQHPPSSMLIRSLHGYLDLTAASVCYVHARQPLVHLTQHAIECWSSFTSARRVRRRFRCRPCGDGAGHPGLVARAL